ncbi:MAG: PAS domain S-box protein [Anaerolineae bacterium]|nr:PAS domain S-box protein [Anaerolineae bacterium]
MTPWPFLLTAAGIGCCALAHRWWHRRAQQSQRRYRRLVECAPVGIAVIADGHLRSANPALCTMLGLSPCQQIDVLAFPPLVEAGIAAGLRRCLETAAPLGTESAYTSPAGRRIHLRCHLTPLPDEGAVLALFEDVTVRKQAQENLEQMQRIEALQCLAGGVAHDLNNHLTVINAYTDLLALDGESQGLAAIRKSAHEIGSLAGQLLAFSREPPDQPAVSIDLNRLIDDSRDLLQLLAGKEVGIEMRLAPDLHLVEAIPGQMAQVMIALATHTQCTTPSGRTLTLETANAPGGITLSVTDTGLELDEQTRARLFEPFASTAQGCRTGLGLAVAHGIVTRHGGRIQVTGHPGRGTTFTIYLPEQKGSPNGQADLAR